MIPSRRAGSVWGSARGSAARSLAGGLLAACLVAGCASASGDQGAVASPMSERTSGISTPVPGSGDGQAVEWGPVPDQVAITSGVAGRDSDPVAEPVSVEIPALGVRSRLDRLKLDAARVLIPPADPAVAGWFSGGVRPGEPGPAVIAGHLDSRTGPGVFARLGQARPGQVVVIGLAGGGTARFRVDAVRTYPKNAFPTAEVYGPAPDPQLRLITCGGAFNQARGHYTDNVIVFASELSQSG
ncbi:class F sortase [Streptosporangiaceae bacterium NEAU-GS5]|nr:class F sortase [Streptosporangiaceae bacterium NEAU-GS5]